MSNECHFLEESDVKLSSDQLSPTMYAENGYFFSNDCVTEKHASETANFSSSQNMMQTFYQEENDSAREARLYTRTTTENFMPLDEKSKEVDNFVDVETNEDENELYYADIAEKWMEEQLMRQDSSSEGAHKSGDYHATSYSVPSDPSNDMSLTVILNHSSQWEPTVSNKSSANLLFCHENNSMEYVESSRPILASENLGQALKRSASDVSHLSPMPKQLTKRRGGKAQVSSQVTCPKYKSDSRLRMDNALYDHFRAKMALREAIIALEKAHVLVTECRAKYVSTKVLVQATAEEECESLLLEETPWNNMFHQFKKYKEDISSCNAKQSYGVEDYKSVPDMTRLSAWIGKNRKDIKPKSRFSGSFYQTRCNESKDINRFSPVILANCDSKICSGRIPRVDNSLDSESEVFLPDSPITFTGAVNSKSSDSHLENQACDDSSVFEDLDPESILADPYKKIALDTVGFDFDPRNSRWNMMYDELKAFKALNGTTLVPHANFGLGSWVKRQQVQYTLYNSGNKSELTEERVHLLNNLGFVWSRRSNTWNENFHRLKKWKEENGTCHIPDNSDDPELVSLSKWVADQRVYYKRYVAEIGGSIDCEPHSSKKNAEVEVDSGSDEDIRKKKAKKKLPKLCSEKIEALKSIGFEFDARDAKWLQKLDVLLQYKKDHGDFLVPSNYADDPTLSNWVASQRQQFKLYKKGCKSHMTERRIKILTDAGFPFSSKEILQKRKEEATQQGIDTFDAKPWIEKYKNLLLYIAKYGCLDSLQKNNPLLAEWVAKQREESQRFGCTSDIEESNENEKFGDMREHIILMHIADTLVSSRASKINSCVPCDSYQDCFFASYNKEDSPWDGLFGSLAAWYIKHGTYSSRGMPSKLKKFMYRQQEQFCLFNAGTNSDLTLDRIEKLNDIYFPFNKVLLKELSGDDIAAYRRNRSWEEYRLDLAISYIQKGNYDMQGVDDIELRRWATEQKRQHKLYLSGQPSSLSFAQIQRLIDIKFISKRPKQLSWTEMCGDLMAFRIQFGSYDLASACNLYSITKNSSSKVRSFNLSTNFSSLKNIQDWVNKIKAAMDELPQDQFLKLRSVGFA